MITSYAQNFEDVMLWRALRSVRNGRYLDIGAQDPTTDSVSMLFYTAGWRGVHVEASAFYAERLREARPDEIVIQAAVSDEAGPISFFEVAGTGLSTGVDSIAQHHRAKGFDPQEALVPVIRLDAILDRIEEPIHWMKIDVEGMEANVLRSWGAHPARPWVLVIEATFPNSTKRTDDEWNELVIERGYQEAYFDGLSKYFVHENQKRLLRRFDRPPNVFDKFVVAPTHFSVQTYRQQLDGELAAVHTNAGQKIEDFRAEADRVREDRAKLDVALGELRTAFGDSQQQLENALAHERSLQIELNATASQVAERENAIAASGARIAALEEELQRHVIEAERLHTAVGATDQEHQRAAREAERLQMALVAAEAEQARVVAAAENAQAEAARLRGDLEATSGRLIDREQAFCVKEATVATLDVEVRRQAAMIEELHAAIFDAERARGRVDIEVQRLQQGLDFAEAALARVPALDAEIQKFTTQVDQLRDAVLTAERGHLAADAEAQRLRHALSFAEAGLARIPALETNLQKRTAQSDRLREDLVAEGHARIAAASDAARLQQALESSEHGRAQAEADLRKRIIHAEELRDAVVSAERKQGRAEIERQRLSQALSFAASEESRMATLRQELAEEIVQLKQVNLDLARDLRDSANEHQALRFAHHCAMRDVTTADERAAGLKGALHEVDQRRAMLEASVIEMAERNRAVEWDFSRQIAHLESTVAERSEALDRVNREIAAVAEDRTRLADTLAQREIEFRLLQDTAAAKGAALIAEVDRAEAELAARNRRLRSVLSDQRSNQARLRDESISLLERLAQFEEERSGRPLWTALVSPAHRRRADLISHEIQTTLSDMKQLIDSVIDSTTNDDRSKDLSLTKTRPAMSAEKVTSGTAILTVVSNNYLHFARTLLKSVSTVHPEADLFCVIVDNDMSHADALSDEFRVIRLDELALPGGKNFYFQYNVLELNTAVKPWALAYLLNRNYDKVIYIDPDIRLYRGMNEVMDGLNHGSDIIITPHLLAPVTDYLRPTELDIRRAGTYNFGFCAVRNTVNTMNFVKWWQSKLERGCIVALEAGIFVDQSWIDLVPGLFDHVEVLRHPGYNVAYWNLAQRDVQVHRGNWTVNGKPLVFFHYSGLNPLNPAPFSKHQDRFTLDTVGPSKQLIKAYVQELLDNGVKKYSSISYGFGSFDDGETIPMFFHELYRNTEALRRAFGADPYSRSSVLLDVGRTVDGEAVTWAMMALWSARVDLQAAFPLSTGDSVRNYRAWFAHDGLNYYSAAVANYHRELVLRPHPEVAALPSGDSDENTAATVVTDDPVPATLTNAQTLHVAPAHQLDDVNRVQSVFYAVLGRFAEPEAIDTYRRILGKQNGRLRMWKAIAMSRENRHRPGWISRAWTGLRVATNNDLVSRFDWLPTFSEGPSTIMPTPDAILVETPTPPAVPPAEMHAEVVPVIQENWYDQRIDALRNKAGPFWLHHADPDSPETGYWTASTVRLQLPETVIGRTARVHGSYNAELVARQNGSAEAHVAIFLRDELLYVEKLTQTKEFEFQFELPENLGARPNLVILSEKYFIPAEIDLGADGRELALKLKKVSVGNTTVFDCALADPILVSGKDQVRAPGINLIGYIKAELGVGEAARSLAAAARSADIPYSLIDVGFQSPNRQNDTSALAAAVSEKQSIDILYVNADQTPTTLNHLRKLQHAATLRIGVWHWEQPILPERYRGSFWGLNEVWVPTSFVQAAVSAISPVPVVKITDAIQFDFPAKPNRKRFGLPNRSFLALMMYDFHSYQYRKNPDAAVAAFRRAAKDNKNATLVIKTINAKHHQTEFQELKKAVANIANVVFINDFLSRAEVYELQACCDVLLSLHRAEGFGLAPAEMMFMGKPVIATGWSGNMDFMTPMNSYPVEYTLEALTGTHGPYEAGQLWAEADIDHAGWCLKQVIEHGDNAQVKGRRAAADIRTKLSPEVVGRQMRDRLNLLANQYGIA